MRNKDPQNPFQVVAGVIEHNGKILCACRGVGRFPYLAQKFEFPGGKLELGETEPQALAREIREELSLEVVVGEKLTAVDHQYPDFRITLHAYRCQAKTDVLRLNEHTEVRWLAPGDLHTLDWAEADLPIVAMLRCESTAERNEAW